MNSRVVRARRAQGFEWDPPNCRNCEAYAIQPHQSGRHPWCSVGQFYVQPSSICDRWVDKTTGETLTQEEQPK